MLWQTSLQTQILILSLIILLEQFPEVWNFSVKVYEILEGFSHNAWKKFRFEFWKPKLVENNCSWTDKE